MRQKRVHIDSSVRRSSNGTALLGGSPFRLVRLSEAGSRLVDAWHAQTDEATSSEVGEQLRQRLLDANILQPIVDPTGPLASVGFVVPVFGGSTGLNDLLTALRRDFPEAPIVVVDDATPDPVEAQAIGMAAAAHQARLIRHDTNQGPGPARNTGWRDLGDRAGTPDIVMFIDVDVVPVSGSIATVLAHFDDEQVAAAAPRVRAQPGTTAIDAYEADNSPIDLGALPSRMVPRSRVGYLPSAALAVRRSALVAAGGFDASMRYGEDVDLVWRLHDLGHRVRYEPAAIVHHRNRATIAALWAQRHSYGTSAATLVDRHGDYVAPARLSVQAAAIWVAGLFGSKLIKVAAVIAAAATSVPLARTLKDSTATPQADALRLTFTGQTQVARSLALLFTRYWAPLMMFSRRGRRLVAAAMVVPALIDWVKQRPALNPAAFVAMRSVDFLSYCSGVWSGVLRRGSPAALLPEVRIKKNVL